MIPQLHTGINHVGLPYSNAGGAQSVVRLSHDNFAIKNKKRLKEAFLRFRRYPVSILAMMCVSLLVVDHFTVKQPAQLPWTRPLLTGEIPTMLGPHPRALSALGVGAAGGNRTRVASLEGWCSTIELQLRIIFVASRKWLCSSRLDYHIISA